jgi:hypothetical protein
VDLPREVLIEPLGLGTPGAYIAQVASRVLTSEELGKLKGQEEECLDRESKKTGTHETCTKSNKVITSR